MEVKRWYFVCVCGAKFLYCVRSVTARDAANAHYLVSDSPYRGSHRESSPREVLRESHQQVW